MSDNMEALSIRARPRPVRRFSRKALMIAGGTTGLLILGSLAIAMQPATHAPEPAKALYNTNTKHMPDGFETLPVSYADIEPQSHIPQLGPPLPGDLGGAFLQKQNTPTAPEKQNPFQYRPTNTRAGYYKAAGQRSTAPNQKADLVDAAYNAPIFFALSSHKKISTHNVEVSPPFGLDAIQGLMGAANAEPPTPGQSIAGLGGIAPLDPNGQMQKRAFTQENVDKEIYNPHQLQSPVSPYQVMAGTIIPASLITGLNSDLPGQVIAQVTENVYDSVSGQYLLIPQGTKLLGRYDNAISFGQKRALVIWTRLILPDGSSLIIDNLPGVDLSGSAGLQDRVNNHTGRMMKAALISTLLGVGSELGRSNNDSEILNAIRDSGQSSINQAGQQIIERNLGIQPTITVRPGTRLRVIVNKDLILKPYQLQ